MTANDPEWTQGNRIAFAAGMLGLLAVFSELQFLGEHLFARFGTPSFRADLANELADESLSLATFGFGIVALALWYSVKQEWLRLSSLLVATLALIALGGLASLLSVHGYEFAIWSTLFLAAYVIVILAAAIWALRQIANRRDAKATKEAL